MTINTQPHVMMKNKMHPIRYFMISCTLLCAYHDVAFSQNLQAKTELSSLALLANHANSAQEVTISGIVTDREGNVPLPGVSILAKGTTIGTVTDIDGKYSLTVPDDVRILVFSFIGYLSQEVPLEKRNMIDIIMEPDIQSLSEVVVVGYGEKEKGELTGSISNISGRNIEQASQMNLTQALQGRLPGLVVNNRGGIPGSDDATILIRG